jgi:hypothetical protein
MSLANMRANGIRRFSVYCPYCPHSVELNVDHMPDELPVPSIGRRTLCTRRRLVGAEGSGETGRHISPCGLQLGGSKLATLLIDSPAQVDWHRRGFRGIARHDADADQHHGTSDGCQNPHRRPRGTNTISYYSFGLPKA